MKYAVVVERGPDLAGCVAVGESRAEVCGLFREAIGLLIEELEGGGQAAPAPQAYELIEVEGD